VFYNTATQLLSAIVAYFASVSVALPATQYVAMPPVAPFCDSLVVVAGQVYNGLPGAQQGIRPLKQDYTRAGDLSVYLYRCTESLVVGEGAQEMILDTVEAQAHALQVMTDQVTLHRAVVNAKAVGTWGDFSQLVMLGPVQPLPIQGNLGGCVLSLACEVM
jgi:hypothetical protein